MKNLHIKSGITFLLSSLFENDDDSRHNNNCSTKTKNSVNQTAKEQGQEDPSSEDMIKNNSTSRIDPEITQIANKISDELDILNDNSKTSSEIVSNFQQMLNRMSTFND